MRSKELRIGFIGTGTVGTALALGLSAMDYSIVAVSSRSGVSAEKLANRISRCKAFKNNQSVVDAADLVFITTPDGQIPLVASEVKWHKGQSVVHCSGADSTQTLEPARQAGAMAGACHPLQTFASVDQAIQNLPGSTFAIEAEEPLLSTLKEIVAELNGSFIELKATDKVVYHAAAVIACNYMVTLVKLATDLWKTFDVPPETATKALMPLLKGTLNNIENVGIPGCLTGPIARGDTGTIKKHIDALGKVAPDILSTYRELGRQTIPIASAKGKVNEQQARELAAILSKPACQESKSMGETK